MCHTVPLLRSVKIFFMLNVGLHSMQQLLTGLCESLDLFIYALEHEIIIKCL